MEQKHIRFSWNPIHPRRDWKRLFVAFAALFVGVVGWSAYLFFSSESKEEAPLPQAVEVENPTSRQLERISSFFDER